MKPYPFLQIAQLCNASGAAVAALAAAAFLLGTSASAQAEREPRLAAGPYSVLQAVLKKSFFRLEVARVQIRVDEDTQRKLAQLASGRKQSQALEDRAVRAIMATRSAMITSELKRDVPFDKYAGSVYQDLQSALEAGLIGERTHGSLAQLLPDWLRTLRGRGARKGDRFMCRIQPGSIHIIYRASDNSILLDRTIAGADVGFAILGSYLGPASDFRKELLRSVFR